MTLLEFQERFKSEEDCLKVVEEMRWPHGYMCPNCEHDVGYRLTGRPLIQCAVCRHQTSVTAGTVFHKTRIPLRHWFWIIALVAQDKGGASATRLAAQLGMHYRTVWHILHKIREAMSNQEDARKLSGLIELDQGFFGGTGRGKGRGKKHKAQVLVMVESFNESAGNLVMKVLKHSHNMECEELEEIVEQRIAEGRHSFKTDKLQAHFILPGMGHSLSAVKSTPESAKAHLPWVHVAISNCKRFLMGTYHGVSHKHLQSYLDEFCFRFNRRFQLDRIISSLLRACVFATPVMYAELRS
jgi:transposase-like protein